MPESNDITLDQYQAGIARTCVVPSDQPEQMLILASLGLAGETGEIVDHVKKHVYHGHDLDIQHLKKEVGDALWYLTLACQGAGFTLNDALQANVAKLQQRYPGGFEVERSLHRSASDD